MQWHSIAFKAAAIVVALWAWRRGGSPEQSAAALFLTALVASNIGRSLAVPEITRFSLDIVVIDGGLLASLIWLALKADRQWPIWCVAWQTVSTAGHLLKLFRPDLTLAAYQVLLSLSSWPTLFLLAKGIRNHQRRLRQHGADPSWSRSCPQPSGAASLRRS